MIRVGILVAAFLVLFGPALSRMLFVYLNDPNYSYGFLIPFVSLFYVYLNRERLLEVEGRPCWSGLGILIFSVLLYLFAILLDPPVHGIARLAMLGSLVGLIVQFAGWRVLRAYAFPIGYLVLMFPLPKQFEEVYITLPLQAYAARSGAAVIEAVGIPMVREGNVIRIPAMDLLVEEACSGIRSLFSLTALSFAMVYLFEKRWWEKILLLAITPPIAVLANVIRVASTGMLAQWASPEAAKGFYHTFEGIAIFAVGMVLLFACAWILRVLIPPPAEAGPDGDSAPEPSPQEPAP